jgi:hypothetical protein
MLSRMLTLFLLAFSLSSLAQKNTETTTPTYHKNETAIRALLAAQTKAWNEGDLVGFMEGYLPSDSLLFVECESCELHGYIFAFVCIIK